MPLENCRIFAVQAVAAMSLAMMSEVPAEADETGTVKPLQLADAEAADQASGTGKAALTEIIVTAERRRETLQEAPLTVTAVSADAVQNLDIGNLETVQFISPNLSFSGQVDYTQVYIRGVGTKVTGHTDTVGTAAYNLALSQRRAAAVQKQLVADGIPAADIATVGVGKSGLLIPTGDQVREPRNRRAEIRL